jgi:hypothetical protein
MATTKKGARSGSRTPCRACAGGEYPALVPMAKGFGERNVAIRQEQHIGSLPRRVGAPSRRKGSGPSAFRFPLFRFPLFVNGSDGMAETSTIEMRDRELFAAMAMQALITRGEGWAADMIAKQAVSYADALIEALAEIEDRSPGS